MVSRRRLRRYRRSRYLQQFQRQPVKRQLFQQDCRCNRFAQADPLTENGPIPDIDSTFDDGSVWSFWMPWYNTWNSEFLNQTDNSVWQKNLSDSRIISLKSTPGRENISARIASKNRVQNAQIVQQGKTLLFTLQKASRVSLYSLAGKRLLTIGENLSAGTHSANLTKLSKGIYLVRIQNDSGIQLQKIFIQ